MVVKFTFACAIAKLFKPRIPKHYMTSVARRATLVASTMEENMADYSVAEHFARVNEVWIAFAQEKISVEKREALLRPLRAALATVPLKNE